MDTDYSKPHEENEEGLKANHRSNLQGKLVSRMQLTL